MDSKLDSPTRDNPRESPRRERISPKRERSPVPLKRERSPIRRERSPMMRRGGDPRFRGPRRSRVRDSFMESNIVVSMQLSHGHGLAAKAFG
jgi:hypothetical protein